MRISRYPSDLPGEHKIKLKRKGYADWERKVAVEAVETLEIAAELESTLSAGLDEPQQVRHLLNVNLFLDVFGHG